MGAEHIWRPWLAHALRLPAATHHPHVALAIVLGVAMAVGARWALLRLDSTPFPSHPHGRINFLFLGFIAGALGALSPAALLTANYTAGVFLAIGLSQFHQVRQIDRAMLLALEHAEIVPRGHAYVEGLALMEETRNYLVMLTALLTTATALLLGLLPGVAAGVAASAAITALAASGGTVGAMAEVEPVQVVHGDGAVLVGGQPVLGSPSPEVMRALPQALGVRIRPRDLAARLMLAEPGQRQAILHNVAANLGLRALRDPDNAHPGGIETPTSPLLPRLALDPGSGSLSLLSFPAVASSRLLVRAVCRTPRLETLAHRPLRRRSPEEGA